jgi:dTDP-4-dehydrorhamnose reductase
MRVLVTGAYGQVGSEVVECLRSKGHDAVGHSSGDCDVTDHAMVARCLTQNAYEAIVNCAAFTNVDGAETQAGRAFSVNRDGPENLAAMAADLEIPFIHLSTDFVFDGTQPRPYREEDAATPINTYGASKLAGEEAVRAAAKAHLILRISWVFGAVGSNFVKSIIGAAKEKAVLDVVDDQVGIPTAANHVAEGVATVLTAIDHGWCHWGTYHFTSGGPAVSRHDFAAAILERLRERRERVPLLRRIPSSSLNTPARRPANSHLDCGRFDAAFPNQRADWRSGLDQVMTVLCGAGNRP